MKPSHSRAIQAFDAALNDDEDDAFFDEFMNHLERRGEANRDRVVAEMNRINDPIFQTQRAIGAVEVLLEVRKKVHNIASGMLQLGAVDIAEAFRAFGGEIEQMAQTRAVPVAQAAAEINARATASRRGSN